jgi:hypothetical protein
VLSLAIYIFTLGYRREGAKQALFGNEIDNTETRFTRWLRGICTDYAAEILAMGIAVLEIGSHSFRKGAATFLSTIAGGPTAIAVYLRAGWSLGVQNRYIKPLMQGEGGDQVVGRAATGLSLLVPEFANLPPHLSSNAAAQLTEAIWKSILPGASDDISLLNRGSNFQPCH